MTCLQSLTAVVFLIEIAAAATADMEPPVFTYCPSDISTESTRLESRVNWRRPTVTDNSGVPPYVTQNRYPGEFFATPGSYKVIYMAVDSSGNEANCSFRIIIKKKTCNLYRAPINGALACLTFGMHPACAVMCKREFDFALTPPWLYICTGEQWATIPHAPVLPWPDCSEKSVVKKMPSSLPFFYFDGNASDPSVVNAIKTNFISLLKSTGLACRDQQQCTKDAVNVSWSLVKCQVETYSIKQ